jgi:CheY-like chemotaxis protein
VIHILVIDDEPAIRALLRAILTGAGHEVFEAENGAAALRLLERQPAELAICDMLMPGLDGLETIRLLRQAFPALRIVAMSGGGEVDLLRSALQLRRRGAGQAVHPGAGAGGGGRGAGRRGGCRVRGRGSRGNGVLSCRLDPR